MPPETGPAWPLELFCLAAPSHQGLADAVAELAAHMERRPDAPPVYLAAEAARNARGPWRLVFAADAAGLADALARAAESLALPQEQFARGGARGGLAWGRALDRPGGLAWLFPGQGAQYAGMLADLAEVFPSVERWLEGLNQGWQQGWDGRGLSPRELLYPPDTETSPERQEAATRYLAAMDGGVRGVFLASLALDELLRGWGLEPDQIMGHSIGENAALVAAGRIEAPRRRLFELAQRLGRVMQDCPATVESLAVSAPRPEAVGRALPGMGGRVYWAMDNCPHQSVLFGAAEPLAEVGRRLAGEGAVCLKLPFDRPFHTPLFADHLSRLAQVLSPDDFGPGRTPVFSAAGVRPFPTDPDRARGLTLSQWTRRVKFRAALEALHARGVRVFLEVGPGSMLTGFVRDTLRGRSHLALTTAAAGRPALEQILLALGRLFVRGLAWEPAGLFRGRVPETAAQFTTEPPAAPSSEPAPPEPAPEAEPAPPMRASLPSVAPGLEARRALLAGHQMLMRRFLESQERVWAAFAGRGRAATAPPPPAGSEIAPGPLLGQAQPTADAIRRWLRRFTAETDPFLADHAFGRRVSTRRPDLKPLMVMPFAATLQLLAEAGALIQSGPAALTGVRASRWLALDQGSLVLASEAEPDGRNGARLRVFDRTGGKPILAAEALAPTAPPRLEPLPAPKSLAAPPQSAADFYREFLFHGPRFQGITEITGLGADAVTARLATLPEQPFVAGDGAPAWRLPVTALDCLGQLVAYWLRHREGRENFGIYPFGLEAVVSHRDVWAEPEELTCLARPRLADGVLTSDFTCFDASGRVVLEVRGFGQRYFAFPPSMQELFSRDAWEVWLTRPLADPDGGPDLRLLADYSDELLEAGQGIWARMLAHCCLDKAERRDFYDLPAAGPRRKDWLRGRLAAKDAVRAWARAHQGHDLAPADVAIINDDRGRPTAVCTELDEPPALSLSHGGGLALAATGPPGELVGVDLEDAARPAGDWLQQAFASEELAGLADASPPALLALWCAKEAAAKALGLGLGGAPRAFRVAGLSADGGEAVIEHQGRRLAVHIWKNQGLLLALCRPETQPKGE